MKNSHQSQDDQTLGQPSAMQLCLVVRDDFVPLFLGLLSQGVIIFIQAGCSLKELLCGQLSIPEEYLDARIKTIFINSKAVDGVNSTIVENESTLALSGPMPGLAGATFRRGGFFSGMRSQISYDKTLSVASKSTGKIRLKLFNLVVKELGPGFLERGVWLKREQLENFISENVDRLKSGFISAILNGQDIESTELSNIDFTSGLVRVQVESG
jgi:hypothetical protein